MEQYTIIESHPADDTEQAALVLGCCLAVDKGVRNDVKPHGKGHVCVADDGLAIFFYPARH